MVTLALPPFAQQSLARTLYTGFSDERSRSQRWGENPIHDVPLCETRDPLARFRNNINSLHVVPLGVRTSDVESFMTPKPNYGDVGRRMKMTHNTSRRVPRRPTPAIFPQNDPDRQHSDGTYILSRPTRECLAQSTRDLYISPRTSTTFPDHNQTIRRAVRMDRISKPGKPDSAPVREPMNEYDNFRYTTVYRQSYSNTSLVDDQAKVLLPPIQRKLSYANSPCVKDDDGDGVDEEDVVCQNQEEEAPQQQMPVSDSLINIRARLSHEGWNLPNVYTKTPVCSEDFESHMADGELLQPTRGPQAHARPNQEMGKCPRRNKSGRKRITCSLSNLFPDQPKPSNPCKGTQRLSNERINIRYPKVAQTRIHFETSQKTTQPKAKASCTRSLRKVRFDENPPNVYEISGNSEYLPYSLLVRESQRHEEEGNGEEAKLEEDEVEDQERKDQEERDAAEWGTDEMLEAGWRRNTLLPHLQIPDFRSFCHSKHYLMHMEDVPDLRDNRIYSKRVSFDGINSSAFRG
ncbi:uncharacterized protein LOC124269435 [Haliotis rubra]|uniref:uncharacterized protein LOC124269435 n=1 Tax=Haliotis rubra TaxID=36100 RepID=UPI001EE580ED|nr:uncharacterized protein LOC124269435 [Haliotis rubra]